MAPARRPDSDRDHRRGDSQVEGKEIADVAEDAGVERGERIDSGKTIARGGKDTGHVPGAEESTPDA